MITIKQANELQQGITARAKKLIDEQIARTVITQVVGTGLLTHLNVAIATEVANYVDAESPSGEPGQVEGNKDGFTVDDITEGSEDDE